MLATLQESGWEVTWRGTKISATWQSHGLPTDVVDALGELQPAATHASAQGSWDSNRLRLESVSGDASLIVVHREQVELADTFYGDELAHARRAFAGDVSAAMQLAGDWTAQVDVDLALVLGEQYPDLSWMVIESAAAFEPLFTSQPWWELGPLVEYDLPVVVVVISGEQDLRVVAEGFHVCSLQSLTGFELQPLRAPLPDRERLRLPRLADPRRLHPKRVSVGDEAAQVADVLRSRASASCWALLATAVTTSPNAAALEYFGLQRQTWELDQAGPVLTAQQHNAVFALWDSTAAAGTPDRLLAIRQVISIYRDAPWPYAEDIAKSADSVFIALRGDAVAEAFRARREARALALAVARQTAESATGLAKQAVERSLAVLGAVGAIIVGRTTKALTPDQAEDLRRLLAGFLAALVPWSFLLEGRPVTMAIGALKRDLATFSDLVPPSDQHSIVGSATVKRARRHAWISRIAVPLVYAVAAATAVLVRT